MWDWELMKQASPTCRHEIICQHRHEDFQYTRAVSYGTERDEYCLHNHAMYELVYCLRGDVVYQAESVRYRMEPGSLLIISPAVLHKLFVCSDAPFERHTIFINYFGRTSALSSLIAQCQRPVGEKRIGSAYYGPAQGEELRHMFERLSQAAGAKDEAVSQLTPFFAQALAAELAMTIYGKDPERYSVSSSKTIDTLLLYLSQNFTNDISLSELSERFFLSKDYCNRLFHKVTGMTVMQYVLYNRVLYARQLLSDGVAAATAAKRAGFSDYSNFYRAYRKVTGRMPSDDYQVAGEEESGAV